MDEVLTMPSAEDAAYLKKTLTDCIAEIDRLRAQMSRNDVEIAQSRERTWALLAEIKTMRTQSERKAV